MEEFRGLTYLNGSSLHPTQSFRGWLLRGSREQETIELNEVLYSEKIDKTSRHEEEEVRSWTYNKDFLKRYGDG